MLMCQLVADSMLESLERVRKEEREVTPRVLIYLLFFIEGDVTKVLVPEELLKLSSGKSSVCTHNHNIKLLQLSN